MSRTGEIEFSQKQNICQNAYQIARLKRHFSYSFNFMTGWSIKQEYNLSVLILLLLVVFKSRITKWVPNFEFLQPESASILYQYKMCANNVYRYCYSFYLLSYLFTLSIGYELLSSKCVVTAAKGAKVIVGTGTTDVYPRYISVFKNSPWRKSE